MNVADAIALHNGSAQDELAAAALSLQRCCYEDADAHIEAARMAVVRCRTLDCERRAALLPLLLPEAAPRADSAPATAQFGGGLE